MTSPRQTGQPAKGGDEHDAFSRWRKLLCYLKRSGAAKAAKRSYNRRVRHQPIRIDARDGSSHES